MLNRSAILRSIALSALAGSLFCLGGCLNSMLGVLLAPEAVAYSAVTDVGSRAGAAASETLGELDGINQTLRDLDRIIAENPDAENTGKLSGLRDDLRRQEEERGAPESQPKTEGRPLPPSEFERRDQPTETTNNLFTPNRAGMLGPYKSGGDHLVLDRHRIAGRGPFDGRSARQMDDGGGPIRSSSTEPGPVRAYQSDTASYRLRSFESYATPTVAEDTRRQGQ